MIYPCKRKQHLRPDDDTVCPITCTDKHCRQPEQSTLPTNFKIPQCHDCSTPTNHSQRVAEAKVVRQDASTDNGNNIPDHPKHGTNSSERHIRNKTDVVHRSSRISATRSISRPIYTTSNEIGRRNQELSDLHTTEMLYANATWRMYDRIITYRERHPLPNDYFRMEESTDDNESNQNDTNNVLPCNSIVDDDVPFMIFELDML
jgi:hypothetical protein